MIHPRTETALHPSELLRLALVALEARRPGTLARILESGQVVLIKEEAS